MHHRINGITGLSFAVLAAALTGGAAAAQQTSNDDAKPTEVIIRAKRLDAAQAAIRPDVGASSYSVPQAIVEALPGGGNASLSDVILQAPGVTQDSFGQLHIRGDHDGVQYRLNGVILPQGLSSYGEVLSPRIARSIDMITGALPAQYGLRTAAIINVTTQTGLKTGGVASIYGGSHGDYEPSLTYGGSTASDTVFGSLSYRQSQLGIEAPYNVSTPPHDRTAQLTGFGYYDHIVDDDSRLSLIGGVSDQSFQLPNTPGLSSRTDGAGYTVNGVSDFASDHMQSHQHEVTDYVIASYLRTAGAFTGQMSLFARTSKLDYTPDWDAELAFTGIAQSADKRDTSLGLQAEGSWMISNAHTVRAGLITATDSSRSLTLSHVFRLDGNGAQTSDAPVVITDAGRKTSSTLSLYLQDEWKPLDHVVLNYGLRYDKLNAYRTEDQLSPRINFVWTPSGATTIHGGYARYFTPPPYELIASNTQALFAGTSFNIAGRNDTPYAQRDNYYDLGIQQKIGPRITLGVDAYQRVARYLIDEGQFGAPIILTPFNYRYGRNKGTEFTFDYDGGPMTAYLNLAIAKAQGREVVSSQFNFDPVSELPYIASHFIYVDHDQTTSASGGITYGIGETHLAVDAIYGSGLRTDGGTGIPNGGRLPAYAQLNLSISHHFKWAGGMDARLDLINAADRAYEIRDGSGVGVGAPQWGARRGVFVGLSKTF
ncbi:MAG: TonB-dependent receptor [Asticcacaulis sp.]